MRDEDDDVEYDHDEDDARAAGYRRVRDPRGGTRMVRTYRPEDPSEVFFG